MRFTTALTLGLTLAVGCQQKTDRAPKEPSGAPQAAAPQGGPSSLPSSSAATPPSAAPAGDPVKGTLEIAAGAGQVGPSDVLFIMARKSQAGGGPGPLVAVKRMSGLSASSFPAPFELGPTDSMMAGTPFTGPFVIYARLDRDGDPMTKTAEDLYGTIEAEVAAGAAGLALILDKREVPEVPGAHPPAHPTSRPDR